MIFHNTVMLYNPFHASEPFLYPLKTLGNLWFSDVFWRFQRFFSDCYASNTMWKMSKYGVFSGKYFPVFGPNTGKNWPEKTSYLITFLAVYFRCILCEISQTSIEKKYFISFVKVLS